MQYQLFSNTEGISLQEIQCSFKDKFEKWCKHGGKMSNTDEHDVLIPVYLWSLNFGLFGKQLTFLHTLLFYAILLKIQRNFKIHLIPIYF